MKLNMKNILSRIAAAAVVAVCAACMWSCSEEDDYTFAFNSPALYFREPGQTQTVSYRTVWVSNVTVSSVPEGWSATLDPVLRSVTVTAPESFEPDDEKDTTPVESGTLTLRGYNRKGTIVSASVYVTMTETVDLSESLANSYVITNPEVRYLIDVSHNPAGEELAVASIKTVWTTSSSLIRYQTLTDDGKMSFMAGKKDDTVSSGNALVAAYDAAGNILWRWHLWVTPVDPEADVVSIGGRSYMSSNLGAYKHDNSDNDAILASYGLYYQWGCPVPFIGPRYYNCASGYNTYIYDSSGLSVYVTPEESESGNSTLDYVLENPLAFITCLETARTGSDGAEAWSDDVKTIYDPCPAGWRVPQSGSFDGLSIAAAELAEDIESLNGRYGWTLTDGAAEAFFFAGGRRNYLNGSIENMNTMETPRPWTGYYWTSGLDATRSTAYGMYFNLNTEDAALSVLEPQRGLQLSNGLQIRCVRDE